MPFTRRGCDGELGQSWEGGQDSDGALCSGASSVTFARPVRARQDFTHLADWSRQGHAGVGRSEGQTRWVKHCRSG